MIAVKWISTDLRTQLDRIISNSDAGLLDAHIPEIEDLASRHDLAIRLVARAADLPPHVCYESALGIHDNPLEVSILRSEKHHVAPNYLFMHFLLERGFLSEVETSKASDGYLAIYGGMKQVKHAGRIEDASVLSKWGIGHLWRHGVGEVPTAFGERVQFYQPINREQTIRAFESFARSRLGDAVVDERLKDIDRSG